MKVSIAYFVISGLYFLIALQYLAKKHDGAEENPKHNNAVKKEVVKKQQDGLLQKTGIEPKREHAEEEMVTIKQDKLPQEEGIEAKRENALKDESEKASYGDAGEPPDHMKPNRDR